MSTLSTKLKEARAGSGLTQEQLAQKAKNGLTANDISKAERALLVPTDAQLKAIAKVTGVTQKSLLDAKDGKKTASSAKKTTAAKKPSAAKTTAKTAAGTSMKVTATERKLVEAYRKASAENRKLALNLLQGKAVEESQFNIGNLLSTGFGGSVSDFFENLVRGINE